MKAEIESERAIISRRTFLRGVAGTAGVAALSAFLPGCGLSGGELSPTPSPLAPSVLSEPGKLIMGSAVDIYTLDPAVGFDSAIGGSLMGIYDALFRHVDDPPRVIPWLAASYDVSDDAMEWTFRLVENAVFHDGSPVTAAAVKYSAERLLRINQGPASLFAGIVGQDSIQVLDDYNFKINLLQPFSAFLHTLPWLFIVNPDLVEAHADGDDGQTWLTDHEAGSGPFTLGEWKPGDLYEFIAVPDYWKGWAADNHLKGYVRRVIEDSGDRVQALAQGEVHVVDWVSPQDQLTLKESGFVIVEEPSLIVYDIKLNNKEGYTADIHVRKAISYAFDYQALLEAWSGRAVLVKGPLPPSLAEAATDLVAYRFDLEKAKAELALSDWPEGGFELDYVYVTGLDEERKTGEILRDQLALIGITVNIIPMAWTDVVTTFKDAKMSPAMFPLYSSSAYPDPDNYLWSGYHSSQVGQWTNPGHYQSGEMDKLLERARATVDAEERKNLYHQAQQLALDDAVNIFCLSTADDHVYSPRVEGFDYCPVMGSNEDFYWLGLGN